MKKCLLFFFLCVYLTFVAQGQRIYISEESNNSIRVASITPSGFGTISIFISSVDQPLHVAIDPGNNLLDYQSASSIETGIISDDLSYPTAGLVSVDVCEATAGSGIASIRLSDYDAALTSNNADLSVTWFDSGGASITTADVSDGTSVNYAVQSSSTGWETTGSLTFNISSRPSVANAGVDQDVCGTSATLEAVTPAIGTGAWTLQSGSGGTIQADTDPLSTFTGTAGETYVLRWTVSSGSVCPVSYDDVEIVLNVPPTTPEAGSDLFVCGEVATLSANSPTVGTGEWSIIRGSGGSLNDSALPDAMFTGTVGATYTLRWTISNSPCTSSSDEVQVTLQAPPTTANAGPDQTVCGTSVTLDSNTPTTGTGSWSVISGAGSVLANSSSINSSFSGLGDSTYVVRWTIVNGACPASTDDVEITVVAPPPIAAAGPDQNVCGTLAVLAANTPLAGTGQWSIVSGTGGSITSPGNATTAFSGTAGETYQLRWTISNGICTPTTDDITIVLIPPPTVANAGGNIHRCGSTVTLIGNTPQSGTGVWSVVTGTGGSFANTSSPTSEFTGVPGNTYVLRWTISRAGCSSTSDEVDVDLRNVPTGTGLLNGPLSLCEGEESSITVSGVVNAQSYNWSFPEGLDLRGQGNGATVSLLAKSGTGGTVTVVPVNGCGNGAAVSTDLSILSKPSVSISLPPAEYPRSVAAFSFESNSSIASAQWSFGNGVTSSDPRPEIFFERAGTYSVNLSVVASNGCESSDQKSYEVLAEPDIDERAIKNVITANGDSKNNVLYIEHLDRYPDNEVKLLDRWGVELFSAKNYQNDWEAIGKDGNYLPAGQYICIIKLNANGRVVSRTVSIIRGR